MVRQEISRKEFGMGKAGMETLIYFLVSKRVSIPDAGNDMLLYGVGISAERSREEAIVNEVTSDRKRAENLAFLLADNLVTPVSLWDVIYDWVE